MGDEGEVPARVILSVIEIIRLKESFDTVLTVSSIAGGIGCACCLIWFPLVYDDPQNHPFISAAEKRYIACSLAHEVHRGISLSLSLSLGISEVEQGHSYLVMEDIITCVFF